MEGINPRFEMGVMGELLTPKFSFFGDFYLNQSELLPERYIRISEECAQEVPWCNQFESLNYYSSVDLTTEMELLYQGSR